MGTAASTSRSPEGTRRRLVLAAMELIEREGLGALTTTRVARAAGIVQSGFYVHFDSMDDCLVLAAEHIAGELRAQVAIHRRKHAEDAHGHFRAMLGLFSAQPGFAKIFLNYRRDASALGQVLRRFEDDLRSDLENDLWRAAEGLGAGAGERPRLAILADVLLAAVLAAGASLLDGRQQDAEMLCDELLRYTVACANAYYGRLGGVVSAPPPHPT